MIATKTCRVCGEDCAARPRIKDPRGRYYCTDCYETARNRRQRRFIAPPDDPDPGDLRPGGRLGALADDLGGIAPCPNCTRPLAATDVVCPACGLNRRTGQQCHTRIVAATPAFDPASPRIRLWPVVIGVGSLLIGVTQAGSQAANVGVALTGGSGPFSDGLWELLISSVFFLIALQLVLGAVNILRRRQVGIEQACLWAKIQLALCVIGAAFLGFVALVSSGAGFETAPLISGGFVALGIAAAWPVILLVWFSRAAILEQIRHEWA